MMHKRRISRFQSFRAYILLPALIILLFSSQFSPVQAQFDSDHDGISDTKEVKLANLYVPVLQFKLGEKFFPVDVSYHLENSVLKRRSGEEVILVDEKPSINTISTYTDENYFLDNKLGGLNEIAVDYSQKRDSLGYTVYARVTRESNFIIVQYWFFYIYNDASLNRHEGDWEMIEILLDESEKPVSAVYSQHLQGQRASWVDVEKVEETHPKVYVALGSHANYFRPYQGKLGTENDEVGADGRTLTPSEIKLVILGEHGQGNHPPSQNWLDFGGRWGDWAKLGDATIGFAGPHGPGHGENSEKWRNPASWGQKLYMVNSFWFTLSWLTANFLYIFLVAIVGLCSIKVWKIVKLKKTGRLNLLTILKTKASIGILLRAAGILLIIAGMFLPWYIVKADIKTTLLSTEGEVELLIIDGFRGVQVNLLSGDGLSSLFGLRVPLGLILLAGIILSILDTIGVEKTKSLGNKYIRSGIGFLILFGFLLLLISQITSILPSVASSVGASLPPEVVQMAQTIAEQPFQGEEFYQMGRFGSVYLVWGLGIGAYLLIVSAFVTIIGGFILRGITEKHPNQ